MPGPSLTRALAIAGWVCAPLAIVLCVAATVTITPGLALWTLPFLGMLVAGTIAWRRLPENLAARRLLVLGAVVIAWNAGSTGFALAFGEGEGSWTIWANVALHGLDLLVPAAVLALLVVYPDGRYQRRHERLAARAALGLAVAVPTASLLALPEVHPAAVLLWTEGAVGPLEAESPLHLPALSWLGPPLEAYSMVALGVLPLLGAILLGMRFRRLDAAARRQVKWPLLGALLFIPAATNDVLNVTGLLPTVAANVFEAVVITAVPALLGIGLVRPDLLDVDLVLRRSLAYLSLWLAIVLAYVGIAAALGVAASGEGLPVAVAVAVVATLLLQPARRLLVRRAARWAYGERPSREELLGRVGGALEHALEPGELAVTLADTIREGLGLAWVRVEVTGRPPAISGQEPAGVAEPVTTAPLAHAGQRLGTIACGPPLKAPVTVRERQLLATLARQAALALHNARLASELGDRLEQIRRQAAELAASRARLVAAQETARRSIERDLHDGVQQELVALIAQIGLARQQLPRQPERTAETLADLQAEARQALADLREVARGIHPSVLTDRGILEAIEGRAARLPLGVTISCPPALAQARFPDAVEGAVYFFVCEAFANALKHAGAERVTVRLEREGSELVVAVCDDGVGFEPALVDRSGLDGLADRVEALGGSLEVASRLGAGTTLTARLACDERVLA